MRRDLQAAAVRPNAGHAALVDLERQRRLRALLTQNIDGLHQAAGSSPGVVLELHGRRTPCPGPVPRLVPSLRGMRRTGSFYSRRAPAGGPCCRVCGGVLKSATVYSGQALDADLLDAAVTAAADCDVLLAVGTSLGVHPAAGLVEVAAAHGARVVIVNAQPTPNDGLADLVVRTPVGQALPLRFAPS